MVNRPDNLEKNVSVLSVKDKHSTLEDFLGFIEKDLQNSGYNVDKIYNYLLALCELYNNALQANKKRGINGPSEVMLIRVDDRYTVAIQNKGYFNPEKARKSMFEEDGSIYMGSRGRGIFIAKEFTDGLLFNNSAEEDVSEVYASLDK